MDRQPAEDRLNGNAMEFLYTVFEDAFMAAAEGTGEDKKNAILFLKNGNGETAYKKSGYKGDYALVLEWIECGCPTTPIHINLLHHLHGGNVPTRSYIPPCDDDEDDIFYDYKRV